MTYNKTFWRTVRPFFTDKANIHSKITLTVKKEVQKKYKEKKMIEEVIFNDYDILETFNKIFANIDPNLKIISDDNFETANEYGKEKPSANSINKFKNHPSIKMIISKLNPNERISFLPSFVQWNFKTNQNLDTKKTIQENDIPTKLLKQNLNSFQISSIKTSTNTQRIQNFRLISN